MSSHISVEVSCGVPTCRVKNKLSYDLFMVINEIDKS